ncbi:glycosyltransferase family 2 protein [Baaleninema simplex]|uniref:glycosyltransferase family 2 protein n=1 Tax=Baaleninema simplex TaxID=2862350 RepID=UPI00034B94DE|nr:glycosyltransferase family A protein [Baaleninema simplex]
MVDSTVEVTAIAPVKDRAEIREAARSLLAVPVRHLVLCDGGSTQPNCLAALAELESYDCVSVLRLPQPQFNKAQLLNWGIRHASSEILLTSDADILWNRETVVKLVEWVREGTRRIGGVARVRETDSQAIALRRSRYSYRCTLEGKTARVAIVSGGGGDVRRPGCGLLCARRRTFEGVGGYKERFRGWGWEDRDLLMRAELLGATTDAMGEVTHLSHSDAVRNHFFGSRDPVETRDRNLVLSLTELSRGQFWGDLPSGRRWKTPFGELTVMQEAGKP